MNILKLQTKKTGFTLVELLIVMLIIAILALGALPTLMKYVTKSKFTSSAIPAIANMRVQIQLHETQYGCLPGIGLDVDGKPYSFASLEAKGSQYIQTMSAFDDTTEADSRQPTYTEIVAGLREDKPSTLLNSTADYMTYHIFNRLDVDFGDLTGASSKPHNFQYIVPYGNGSDHCYIMACCGDGGGLPVGTAYAVMDFYHSATKTKLLAVYEKFRDYGVTTPMYLSVESGFSSPHTAETFATYEWKTSPYIAVPGLGDLFGTFAAGTVATPSALTVAADSYSDQVGFLTKFKSDLIQAGWRIQ